MKLIEPRPVPLGGLRAMTVRRLLPSRDRRMVGAWCFIDHYGPDDVALTGGMRVAPHPHTGLQTASWIFTGTIEHRDSLGTVADVRPGELNLMTAGYGINHSEYSTPATSVLHGIQLWIALPHTDMNTTPAFENFMPKALTFGRQGNEQGSGQDASAPATVQARVFLGELGVTVDGETKAGSSPVTTFSPLLGAEILVGAPGSDPRADKNPADDAPRRTLTLALNPEFEHGFVVDTGALLIKGQRVAADEMLYIEPGTEELTIETIGATRLILLGGAPFGEKITMWWNFIGRSHEDVVEARAAWNAQAEAFEAVTAPAGASGTGIVTGGALAQGEPESGAGSRPEGEQRDAAPAPPRFGGVVLLPGEYEEPPRTSVIPAPDLPNARLKQRGD
ncbi:pirin family protein [Rothia nasisuis]|uniref:pirin family protein n=1 Tax=Rothia nasisuis TaxID=2109647 RepID=UPI001F360D71|nr:pirin family protein [Rothia nasisuis]